MTGSRKGEWLPCGNTLAEHSYFTVGDDQETRFRPRGFVP